jgi:hypothetical protein
MSALPPKADIAKCDRNVRLVPEAEIPTLSVPRKAPIARVMGFAYRCASEPPEL